MKKCITPVLLIIFIFLTVAIKAHATTISTYANGVTACTKTSTANTIGSPTGSFTSSDTNTCTLTGYGNLGIPSTAAINQVQIDVYSTGGTMGIFLDENGSDVCSDSADPLWINNGNGLNTGNPATLIFNAGSFHCNHFTTTDFNDNSHGSNSLEWRVNSFLGGNFALGGLRQTVTYSYVPSIAISNLVASAGSASATFNITGDTTHTQAGELCKVSLYEQDKNTNNILTQAFATIILDANNPRTTTYAQGNIYYGFGFTSSVSTWEADNIIAPYFSSKSVQIMSQVNCSHQTTNSDGSLSLPILDVANQGLNSSLQGSYVWDPSLIATPSALQNAPAVFQGSCSSTDWICDFKQWLYTFVCDSFCPNTQLDTQELTLLQYQVNSKAPFGYINAAFALDTSYTATSEAVPPLTVKLTDIAAIPQIHMASIAGMTVTTVDPGNKIQTFIHDYVRPILTFTLYGLLIFYIWNLTDRLEL